MKVRLIEVEMGHGGKWWHVECGGPMEWERIGEFEDEAKAREFVQGFLAEERARKVVKTTLVLEEEV